jgi:potassium-transporting ATPase ATP-binding subunit
MNANNERHELMSAVDTTRERQAISLFQRDIVKRALVDSLIKLDPRVQIRNPVMFVVEIGSVITTVTWLIQAFGGKPLGGGHTLRVIPHGGAQAGDPAWFTFTIAVWLWLTVIFANMAEAFAEGRGRAQADTLRAMRKETVATMRDGSMKAASALTRGDIVVVAAGDLIPGDGTVIEGIATVDESAITGESAPVIRESGGDRSAVTGGTRVTSDRIVVEITQEPGRSFLDRMIALVEGAQRRKTPNEIALNILLAALTLIFMIVVATLRPFGLFAGTSISETTLIALLVALIPTTIGALLSAIGIAGMDRLVRRNVLALSGRAVEASGDVDVLLLDKTGTITIGNRLACEFIPMPGVPESELAEIAQLASLADETPEGRSIVVLAKQYGIREHDMSTLHAEFVAFTAQTRMSGVNIDGQQLRKGAGDAIIEFVRAEGGSPPPELQTQLDRIGREGGTPLAVSRDSQALGVVYLKDTIKEGMRARFEQLRAMGIKTVMVTGDNRLTAAKIAEESGVDDFLAEATPEAKLALIREQQQDGRLVAMTGDGTNDAPALAQADVGVAMNTGTQAAREAGNMVDLDSNPTKLIEIVEVGKQLLITRGALTTFSIANDVAKYFAILPAIFITTYATGIGVGGRSQSQGPLHVLNIMNLGTPQSAIVSAIIFNAIVIPLLIPLSLRGVRYRPIGASALLRRNLLIYGLGGILAPFIGIKLIDLIVHNLLGG